jgi:hypothetical protein
MSEEEVFGLDGVEDSDQDSAEEQEEDDIEYDEEQLDEADRLDDEMVDKIRRNIAPHGQLTDDDDDDDDDRELHKVSKSGREKSKSRNNDEVDGDGGLAWGNKRASFYVQRGEDVDDESTYKEEEAEALRLQRKRLEKMTEEDFMDGVVTEHGDKDTTLFGKASDGGLVQPLSELLEQRGSRYETLDTADARKEALSKLSPAALKSMVQTRASDVVKLLKEWDERSAEALNILGPALDWLKVGGTLLTDQRAGAQYLCLKYREYHFVTMAAQGS